VRDGFHQVAHLVDLGVASASISRTSKAVPSPISLQLEQALHGSGVGPCSAVEGLGEQRAVVVCRRRAAGEEEGVRHAARGDAACRVRVT